MAHEMTIHCIGDSHVSFFSGAHKIQPEWPGRSTDRIPLFATYRLGPVLAFNLCKEGTKTQGREKLFSVLKTIPANSTVMLSFGEIDCRVHLLKQADSQGRPLKEVVDECVVRYMSVVKEVQSLGYRVLLWEVIPSTMGSSIAEPEYIAYGSCQARNEVTRLFNTRLRVLALDEHILTISVFDELVRKDDTTDMWYYSDTVHLSQRTMAMVISKIHTAFPNRELPLFAAARLRSLPFFLQRMLLASLSEVQSVGWSVLRECQWVKQRAYETLKKYKIIPFFEQDMVIGWKEKMYVLYMALRSLYLLPKKNILTTFINPIDSTRYTEFAYLLEYLKREKVVPRGKVLDISSPFMMAYILSHTANVLKTDVNVEEEKEVQPNSRLAFELADGTALSYADNTFDMAYSISVIEHIYGKYTQAVKEMIRTTKSGGLIYISFPVSKNYKEEWIESDIYSHQFKESGKTFFQYRFDEQKVKELIAAVENTAGVVSRAIYWERRDGMYDQMTHIMRRRPKNIYLQRLKMAVLNVYYGFFLLENAPKDFSEARDLGNMSIILKKK